MGARPHPRLLAFGGAAAVFLLLTLATPARAEPALVDAAKAGDLAAVAALLASGADPDGHDRNGNTALIFAARDGHLEVARALIAAGTSLDWQDGERVTALILAAHKNHPAVARLLLERGADPTLRDQWGRVALDYAVRRGPDDPIARLIQDAQGQEK